MTRNCQYLNYYIKYMNHDADLVYKIKQHQDESFFHNKGNFDRYDFIKEIVDLKEMRKSKHQKVSNGRNKSRYSIGDVAHDYEIFAR